MSWDVMIFNTQGEAPPSVEEFEEGDYEPLGPAAEVRERLSDLLPGLDWSDTTLGVYDGDGFSIEFRVGDDEPIESMMLHVRGSGDAVGSIVKFARRLGWSALDCSTSEFVDLKNPSQAGWEGFQELRDKGTKRRRRGRG